MVNPKPGRLAVPHSCGMSCQRKRLFCEHPCPLSCHPGPCPPCSTLILQPCYCGKTTVSLRCSRMAIPEGMPLSCGTICNRNLSCDNHKCSARCHPGECLPCDLQVESKCYCGRVELTLKCGEGEEKACSDGQKTWNGRFSCRETCGRWVFQL